ncbi:hypothetical protein EOE18_00920 [Novosphingobium umbonatum]|uniref:Urate oxidase N-terminal domain-containing protein n=1 Tax=Novosphingobium umbonatum TaxID=1908524 RepID=A0A3S3TSS4_9SPHN|nr:urate hydroxylase PuuD [Novosphingobium umbonatum]RVU07680.1 hypothetical protein EOE18_00920 [Novosphingobium umbonatum]
MDITEWLNLALRWLHLITGIAWIGSSFYFVWLDNHLTPPKQGDASGELWSVHGGGFYHAQKYMVAPAQMPDDLHWFKWEAYFTWVSGFSLLTLVYYVGARSFLIDTQKLALEPWQAIGIGLGAIALGWVVYDRMCRSALGRNNLAMGVVWYGFLVGAAYGLNQVFSARGAYLHIGAMVGTVMAANVFMIIIPGQRKVVDALIAGQAPDPALGARGKQRSLHNNYMTLPVLFIMISHHYPMTFGADRPWLVLALVSALGVAVRHVFNLRHKGKSSPSLFAAIVALIVATTGYVAWEKSGRAQAKGPDLTYADVQPIFAKHCLSCHAEHPVAMPAPPLGVMLDSAAHAGAMAPRIQKVAVDAQVMPLGNMTNMTPQERAKLGAWIAGGAKP